MRVKSRLHPYIRALSGYSGSVGELASTLRALMEIPAPSPRHLSGLEGPATAQVWNAPVRPVIHHRQNNLSLPQNLTRENSLVVPMAGDSLRCIGMPTNEAFVVARSGEPRTHTALFLEAIAQRH